MEQETISILNEDGSLKSKEQFLEDITKLYDKAEEEYKNLKEDDENPEDISYFDLITDPEVQIDVE